MNIEELEKKADDFYGEFTLTRNNSYLDELEGLFEEFLKNNPQATSVWFKYALVEYEGPVYDDLRAIECLNRILDYDPDNIYATLMLVYIYYNFSYINDELFDKLSRLKTDNPELMSMIEHAKALYYYSQDYKLYEQALNNSIKFCQDHVWNYFDLGKFYIELNKVMEGQALLKKALCNVLYVYTGDCGRNRESIKTLERFFDERFRGTYITPPNLNSLFELLHGLPKLN